MKSMCNCSYVISHSNAIVMKIINFGRDLFVWVADTDPIAKRLTNGIVIR